VDRGAGLLAITAHAGSPPTQPAGHLQKKDDQDKPLTPAHDQRSTQVLLLQSGTPAAHTRPAGKGRGGQEGYRSAPTECFKVVFKNKKIQNQPKTC
jgi:hypothetical protein